jgi:hypothetical protein
VRRRSHYYFQDRCRQKAKKNQKEKLPTMAASTSSNIDSRNPDQTIGALVVRQGTSKWKLCLVGLLTIFSSVCQRQILRGFTAPAAPRVMSWNDEDLRDEKEQQPAGRSRRDAVQEFVNCSVVREHTATNSKNKLSSLQDAHSSEDHKEPKYALLFFGLAKQFREVVLPSIQKNILAISENAKCDIYLHNYNITTTSNPRNKERAAPVYPEEVYDLTDNVKMETMEDFFSQRNMSYYANPTMLPSRKFGWSQSSLENMYKQWHSIESVWDLMQDAEQRQGIEYSRVGLFRTDVKYVTPIDIFKGGDAVIPDFGFLVNDRMFYGTYNNAHVWAKIRFPSVPCYKPRHKLIQMHSEFFMMDLVLKNIPGVAKREDICFMRVQATGVMNTNDCRKSGLPNFLAMKFNLTNNDEEHNTPFKSDGHGTPNQSSSVEPRDEISARVEKGKLDQLYHLHIPKTGSSIWREMIQYMCPTINSTEQVDEIFRLVMIGKPRPSCAESIIPGHAPMRSIPSKTIAIIRSPIDRMASGFVHNLHDCKLLQNQNRVSEHGNAMEEMHKICQGVIAETAKTNRTRRGIEGEGYGQGINNSITDLVLSYAKCVSGCSSNMLSGAACFKKPPHPFNIKSELILESLAFVGLTDRWDETLCLWHHKFPRQSTDKPYLSENVNSRKSITGGCKNAVKRILLDDFRDSIDQDPDWGLYKKSVELFDKRLPVHCNKKVDTSSESPELGGT